MRIDQAELVAYASTTIIEVGFDEKNVSNAMTTWSYVAAKGTKVSDEKISKSRPFLFRLHGYNQNDEPPPMLQDTRQRRSNRAGKSVYEIH